MKSILLISLLVLLPLPASSQTVPTITNVEIAGISDQLLSTDLRDSMQKLVGQPYSAATVDPISRRIESEHPEFVVATRTSDPQPGQLRLVFVVADRSASSNGTDGNVNSQYLVESVEVTGLLRSQYSDSLYDEMQKMVGERLDHTKVDDFRSRLRSEPQIKGKYSISDKIERGSQPGHVKLILDAKKLPWLLRVTIGDKIHLSGSQINETKDTDIVESADISGVPRSAVSDTLYADIQKMVGKRIDHLEADHLKEKLESELKKRYSVEEKVKRGSKPDTVRVVYEATQIPWIPERSLPGVAAYHPKQGISLFADGQIVGPLTLGAGTDGDTLTERFKGYRAGLESQMLGTRHLGAKIVFATYGILWKPQTLDTLQVSPTIPGAYRRRQAAEPSIAFAFNRSIYGTAGLSFNEIQMMLPSEHWESAHEATASLRYQSPKLKHGAGTYEFTSGYEIRTATRNLDSDFVYTRHFWDGSYSGKNGKNRYKVSFIGGRTTGTVPLFERFSLGNTVTLRGWNKYDIDPTGGTRVFHASSEWSYQYVGLFFDSGAIWNGGESARFRSSIGFTLGPFALAIPLRCPKNCGVTFLIHFD